MKLNVQTIENDITLTLMDIKKINVLNEREVAEQMKLHLWCTRDKLTANLKDVHFIDSAGFRLLLTLNRMAKQNNKKLVLSQLTSEVMELFELLDLTKEFNLELIDTVLSN